jgi:selenocysteine-specific elongation factor
MGTAGHIDHGKTSLIRALTGVDCDRLGEEKRRGITIELGFAELALANGASPGERKSISVIDVPGHERFVHTMVAGASGIDFVLFVIAADEGVMPQTREHLDICSLLGIRRGIVAVTKIDMVDDDLLALALDDIESFLVGSILENAPVIPVSALTGEGLEALTAALRDLEAEFAPIRSHDLFRIPVDRIFSLHGHGTVITGTMIAGSVRLGDTVQIYPGERTSKVRGLQNHYGRTEIASAGRRTAVNLPDLSVNDIRKGDVVSHPGALMPSLRWTAKLTCLKSSPRPLRHRAEFHLHHGSGEVQARVFFLDREKLQPGESCLCEIRFPKSVVGVFGDRFVLRSFSPLRTVAGGVLLNSIGIHGHKKDVLYLKRLTLLENLVPAALDQAGRPLEDMAELVHSQMICTAGAPRGLSFEALRVLANADSRVLEKALSLLMTHHRAFCFDKLQKLYVADVLVASMTDACMKEVAEYHERHPERQGVKRSELVSGWARDMPPKLAHFVIEQLIKRGLLENKEELVRLPSHTVRFSTQHSLLGEGILQTYQKTGWTPPTITTLLENLGASPKEAAPLMASLRASGQLVRLTTDIWYATEHLAAIRQIILEWFKENQSLDLAAFRTLTGLPRKRIIALFEYFDEQKITQRMGDVRVPYRKE